MAKKKAKTKTKPASKKAGARKSRSPKTQSAKAKKWRDSTIAALRASKPRSDGRKKLLAKAIKEGSKHGFQPSTVKGWVSSTKKGTKKTAKPADSKPAAKEAAPDDSKPKAHHGFTGPANLIPESSLKDKTAADQAIAAGTLKRTRITGRKSVVRDMLAQHLRRTPKALRKKERAHPSAKAGMNSLTRMTKQAGGSNDSRAVRVVNRNLIADHLREVRRTQGSAAARKQHKKNRFSVAYRQAVDAFKK